MAEVKETGPGPEFKRIKTVLIANRGEIACRIIASCKKVSLHTEETSASVTN